MTDQYLRAGLIAAVILFSSTGVHGQELAAGWEGQSGRGYAFFSPRTDLGSQVVVGAAASFLYYDFAAETGRVELTSPGVAIAVGYRIRTSRLSGTFSPGFELRRTSRRTGSAMALTRMEAAPTMQADLFGRIGRHTQTSIIASYGHANRYTWVRAGLTYQLSNRAGTRPLSISAGVEATGQGNGDVRTAQVGGVAEFLFVRRQLSLQIRSGISNDRDRGSTPYAGLGMYHRFRQ